jgi:hypothetical protein
MYLSDEIYTELTHMRISYAKITYVYGKAHVTVVWVILRLEITKLSYIWNVILWSWLHIILIKGSKWANIWTNYMNVFE